MRSKFKWIYTLVLAFAMQFSYAQGKTITGTVTEGGMPLPGVGVIIKGTSTGTETDFNGKYTIKANVGQELEFSFIGMKKQTIKVGASNSVNVSMVPDNTVLGEVVLVQEGYKTSTKARSVVAATTISSETISNRPNASALQSAQGQIAGFTIFTGSGQPGETSNTILRGLGSVNGNTEPLYVIDGVPQSNSSFRALNPDDIDTFTVLKDAGATAVYGNRGANGVVIVNTKKGKLGVSEVMVSSNTGVSMLQNNYYNKMSSIQLLRLEKIKGTGLGSFLTDAQINSEANNTDWQDELLRDGITRNVSMSISGGSEKLRSFNSLSYNDTEGLAQLSKFKRFTFRNNLNGKAMNDKLSYDTNFSIAYIVDDRVPALGTGGVNQNPLLASVSGLPYLSPNDYINGAHLNELTRNRIPGSRYTNRLPLLGYTPLLILDLNQNRTFRANRLQIYFSNNLAYQLTKDLSVKNTFGIDYKQNNTLTSVHPRGFNAIYFAENARANNITPFGGSQTEGFDYDAQIVNTFSVNYSKIFKEKHSLDASAFFENLYATAKSFDFTTNGLNPLNYYPGDGSAFIPEDPNNFPFYRRNVNSGLSKAYLLSLFGTLNYDYNNQFGVGLSIRRDASYRFRGNDKWGNFWSASARWNIDKMDFMKDTKFGMLKLRVSHGLTGNQNIAGGSIYTGPNLYKDLVFFGGGYNGTQGIFPSIGNDDVRWEIITTTNLGLDIEYNKSFRANIDVYRKRTDDLYLPINISSITGQTGISGNYGALLNSGIELTLSYDLINKKNTKLNIYGNFSYNKNEFVDLLPERTPLGNTIRYVGGQIGEYFVFKYAGINPNTGNYLFETKDGNITESPSEVDRFESGESRVPIYQGSFGFNFDYKSFYLTTQFTYNAGLSRFDFDLSSLHDVNSIGQFNLSDDVLRYWTPQNRYTDMPGLNVANQGFINSSDRYLIDASYIRLRNISFGYNIDKKKLNNKLALKLFASIENIYTWSKWRGWDAESPRGSDQYQFPTPRIFTIGAQINL